MLPFPSAGAAGAAFGAGFPTPRSMASGPASPPGCQEREEERITTPAGSTIEPIEDGGYRVCDSGQHCRRAASLWEAQQLVQWAEVHHQPLAPEPLRSAAPNA